MYEIEVAAPNCGGLHFPPLQQRVRGAWDARPLAGLEGGALMARWHERLPGQRIGLDDQGNGYLADPLGEDPALREKIKGAGYALGPARQDYPGVDAVTWGFWMQRAVDAGLARVVQGQPPLQPRGARPRLAFVLEEKADARDAIINRLVAALGASLPADKKRAFDELLDDLEGR